MPELDGLELARKIREMGYTNPILMLSSLNMHPEIKSSPYLSEALSKPVKHTILLQTINRLLSYKGPENTYLSQPASKKPDGGENEKKQLRLLLAEDNLFNQKLALLVLNRLGYLVDMVSSGREAIEALELKHYDLILMDIQMPEMDGVEATQIIRNQYGEKAPYIVAKTANAMEGDREKYLDLGMDDYISKPIDLQHLRITLEKFEKQLNK